MLFENADKHDNCFRVLLCDSDISVILPYCCRAISWLFSSWAFPTFQSGIPKLMTRLVTYLICDQDELIENHSLIKHFPDVHNYPTQKEGGVILDTYCNKLTVQKIIYFGI